MQRQRPHTHGVPFVPLLILTLLLLVPTPQCMQASAAFSPSIRDVPDLMTDLNTPSTFTLVIGHNKPGYDLSRIRFQIASSDQGLLQNSQITSRGTGTNRIVSALPTAYAGESRLHIWFGP
jgi:hypothetical protein